MKCRSLCAKHVLYCWPKPLPQEPQHQPDLRFLWWCNVCYMLWLCWCCKPELFWWHFACSCMWWVVNHIGCWSLFIFTAWWTGQLAALTSRLPWRSIWDTPFLMRLEWLTPEDCRADSLWGDQNQLTSTVRTQLLPSTHPQLQQRSHFLKRCQYPVSWN